MTNESAIKKLQMLKTIAVNAGTETAEAIDKAIEALKEKRPTGQWDYGTQCSVCKGTIIPPKDRNVRVNFCPWCGADMRGGYDE